MNKRVHQLQDKAWYRTFQVFRILAYIFFALVAIGASQGSAAYSYTDISGIVQTIPATPFNWNQAFLVMTIGWLLIEGVKAIIVYIATGQNILVEENTGSNKRLGYGDDALEDWDSIKGKQ